MVNKIKRTSLQSEIIRFILDYIREHDLNPGDKLPSQENLLAMMGVSRTSLREAMKTLEARGILEIQNGKGAYVGGLVDADGVQVIDFTQEKERLLEALEVRKILEREILRMLIHTITDFLCLTSYFYISFASATAGAARQYCPHQNQA